LYVDDNGYMYVDDYNNTANTIYKLDPNGNVVASSSSSMHVTNMFLKDGYLYVNNSFGQIQKLNTSDLSTVKVFDNVYYGGYLTVDNSGNIFTAGVSCEDQQNCSTGNYVNFIMKVTQ
ncbi:MAG: hypothetical protein IE878_07600, partial [Epsilonproteobacteria bacterium]|nr:hypothetical protein [Campylobacterota bacterium]